MVNPLKIAYFQQDIIWEDQQANINKIEKYIDDNCTADILVLPETFNSGFTINAPKVAQTIDGDLINWLKLTAAKHNIAILGSAIIKHQNGFANRLLFVLPNGNLYWYDKRHLFRMGNEHKIFTPGNNRLIVNYLGWRICPLICYDIRFPVWSRCKNDYDILIYVANWPVERQNVFETLVKARAIENQCYTIGVNRVGTDANNLEYIGGSMVADFYGNIMSRAVDYHEQINTVELNYEKLQAYRDNFPAFKDSDNFVIS